MTLDQVDESDRLLDLLCAQGDLLMAGGGSDFADGTITVIGAAIFDGAEEMKELIHQISLQTLDATSGTGKQVREASAVYGGTTAGSFEQRAVRRLMPDAPAYGSGMTHVH